MALSILQADITTLAFPLISAGVYGYPKRAAIQVAVETIQSFLQTRELEVYLVLYDREAYALGRSMGLT